MDSTIIAAIIGGAFTIGAVFVTFVLTRKPNQAKPYINSNSRQILTGHWEGIAHQDAIPQVLPSMEYRVSARITTTNREIQAEADMRFELKDQTLIDLLEITGYLAYDRFLKLEYKGKDKPEAIQFGYLILELSSDGQILYGRFLSYGARQQHLVNGTIQLEKVK